MISPTSNVVPFPIRPAQAELASPLLAIDRTGLRSTVIDRKQTLTAEEHSEYVASIVCAAIRFGRRNERSLSGLPSQLRKWFIDLCDAGDPACLTVRDWLNGNRRYVEQTSDSGGTELLLPQKDADAGEGL